MRHWYERTHDHHWNEGVWCSSVLSFDSSNIQIIVIWFGRHSLQFTLIFPHKFSISPDQAQPSTYKIQTLKIWSVILHSSSCYDDLWFIDLLYRSEADDDVPSFCTWWVHRMRKWNHRLNMCNSICQEQIMLGFIFTKTIAKFQVAKKWRANIIS